MSSLALAMSTAIIHQSVCMTELEPDWCAVLLIGGKKLMVCGHIPDNQTKFTNVYIVNNPKVKGKVDSLNNAQYESLSRNRELTHVSVNGNCVYTEFNLLT